MISLQLSHLTQSPSGIRILPSRTPTSSLPRPNQRMPPPSPAPRHYPTPSGLSNPRGRVGQRLPGAVPPLPSPSAFPCAAPSTLHSLRNIEGRRHSLAPPPPGG